MRTGNPSGAHRAARDARRALDDARDVFAGVTGFAPGDVVFTSGGTEADNLAVFGVLDAVGGVAVCAATEHHAVLGPVESRGGRVVPVDPLGHIDLDRFADALDPTVTLVSVMAVNNETGVIADLPAVAEVVRARAPGAVLHTDAVQAMSWIDLRETGALVDLLSLSAHKFGGPQGVGVLAVRPHVRVAARQIGGGQERERRSGTQNVAGVAGAAAAAVETDARRATEVPRLADLRDRLAERIRAGIPDVVETAVCSGDRSRKVAGNHHVCIPGVEAEALLVLLEQQDVFASAAASCASGAQDPSHVLAAMGVPRELAAGSLRLSLGWPSTEADVDTAARAVVDGVLRLRSHA